MKTKMIIYLLFGAIILIALLYFLYIKPMTQCAKEGETFFPNSIPNKCCSGLKSGGGWPGGYDGDCSLFPPPGGLSKCIKCGDGYCNKIKGENKCNCKEDCK